MNYCCKCICYWKLKHWNSWILNQLVVISTCRLREYFSQDWIFLDFGYVFHWCLCKIWCKNWLYLFFPHVETYFYPSKPFAQKRNISPEPWNFKNIECRCRRCLCIKFLNCKDIYFWWCCCGYYSPQHGLIEWIGLNDLIIVILGLCYC